MASFSSSMSRRAVTPQIGCRIQRPDGTQHWIELKSWKRRINKNESEQNRKQGCKGSRTPHYTYLRVTTQKCVKCIN
jgi:hypothetical protein